MTIPVDTVDKPTSSQETNANGKEATPISAVNKRATQPIFTAMFALKNLLAQLPLVFPVNREVPPSPKVRYRSDYRYLGPDSLLNKDVRSTLSGFEIALYLIDFSALRALLAQFYVQSKKGKTPFDPVSMFLCVCLRREEDYTWDKLAKLLAHESHGLGWRRVFGFKVDKNGKIDTPSESGLRYFFQTVGPEVFDEYCPMFIDLLRQYNFLPERSTFPGDPAERGVTITGDGMLHDALSQPSCQLAMDSCYQPLSENQTLNPDDNSSETESHTEGTSKRPCRATKNGQPRCRCDTAECQECCQKASRLDAEARFIHYDGHNHKNGEAEGSQDDKGKDVYGYRSIVDRILDDRLAIAWNAKSSFYPANTDERTVFVTRLRELHRRFPDLKLGECLYDAAVGYSNCLEAIWDLEALRMVDIRGNASDKDFDACLKRGYDGEGCPLCLHGYPLYSNGYDYDHRRRKYVCNQACRRKPRQKGESVAPVKECPYLKEGSVGFIVNVGKTLPGGKMRLARDIPYGSEEWDARYGRRNLSESRNSQVERLGLKRMKSYGLERGAKEVQVADFLINLHTLARLVREATELSEK